MSSQHNSAAMRRIANSQGALEYNLITSRTEQNNSEQLYSLLNYCL